eukprot:ANDGO_01402.mRNA.1 putative RNA-binding protein C22E12.02
MSKGGSGESHDADEFEDAYRCLMEIGEEAFTANAASMTEPVSMQSKPTMLIAQKPSVSAAPPATSSSSLFVAAKPVLATASSVSQMDRSSMGSAASRPGTTEKTETSAKSEISKSMSKKIIKREIAGAEWEDSSLLDFPPNDFRIFVGNLGIECSDAMLTQAFSRFAGFALARVIRDKHTAKSKGYGFVSFTDVKGFLAAMRDMNNKYVGSKPVILKRSTWKDRMTSERKARSHDHPY